jgi:ketosteroid isomerase-like protein
VTVFGDSAIASGLIDARWKDEQGKTQQITVRFLAMLQKQKGEWKLASRDPIHVDLTDPAMDDSQLCVTRIVS